MSAEKDRLAAQRREEHQAKEKQRLQAKQVQKDKARQAATARKQKLELALTAQKAIEDKQRQEMEITPEHGSSSDNEHSSYSDSEAELLTTIAPPSPVSSPGFRLLPKVDQDAVRKTFTDRLPSGYARHHCPSVIRFRSRTPNLQNLIQNALFDAMFTSEKPKINPMELLTKHTGDVYEVAILTTETLEYVLALLKRPKCNATLLDGPYVEKNIHYAPAAAAN